MAAPITGARLPVSGATNTVAPGNVIADYANYAVMLGPDGLVPLVFLPSGATSTVFFLGGVTALTGGTSTCLDYEVPGGLTAPLIFGISPVTPIPAINLVADALAFYKLRAKQGGDVIDGVNIIQPLHYSSSYVLVHIM